MAKIENTELLNDYMELSVANYYCYDTKTGLELYSGTLESSEIDRAVTSEDIKGGQSNDILASIVKSTDVTLKVTDVIARQDLFALKNNGTIKKVVASDNVYAMHMPKNYTVSTGKTFTLDALPKTGEEVAIYNNKTGKKLVETTDYSISGQTVTISSADILVGDTVFVTGFYYKAPDTAKYFDINNGDVPAMLCVLEIPLFKDAQVVAKKQYIFPKVKLDSKYTSKGQTEKTKNTDETEIKVLKDSAVDYLGRVIYLYNDAEEVSEDVSYSASGDVTKIEPSEMIYDSENHKFVGVPLDIDVFYFKDGEDTKTATKLDGSWSIA